jgi:hypothetical protein
MRGILQQRQHPPHVLDIGSKLSIALSHDNTIFNAPAAICTLSADLQPIAAVIVP